jgi:glycosyltransferase involved in cell wall biosynthesis
MKIGVNSRIYQNKNTGIPFFIKNLFTEILKKDKRNKYIFFQTKVNKKLGVTKIINLSGNLIFSALFDLLLVNYLIKKEKIKVFYGPSNILPLFKINNVKYILTIHDLSFLVFPRHQSILFNSYYRWAVGRSLKNADTIVADSHNTKNDIIKYYKIENKKINVIYPGVKKDFFKIINKSRLVKEKYFFTLTTHPKRKNVYKLLEVLFFNKNLENYKLIIAGLISENQIQKLDQTIKELGLEKQVIIFGYASEEELINLYSNAEFFIYPSFYEGFGFPILEAIACKCLVITSNTSSIKELVPNKNWLFDPYDLEDISAKINRILKLSKRERREITEENYQYAKKFTWENTAKKYLYFLNNY